MSEWDIKGLETNFEGFRKDRYPELSPSDAFERFAVRQILKDADLSDDEIESGILGGGDDGGIDAIASFGLGTHCAASLVSCAIGQTLADDALQRQRGAR